jgi:hypothetical protein
MTAVDKRMYYLMLSPSLGQEFANDAGFSMPSEEVQEIETYDVIARWALLTATGLLSEVLECSDWFCELESIRELDEDERDEFHKTLVSHSMALLNRVLDSEKVILMVEKESLEEYEDD